jgi:YebC/PmpR family DNA-binding regulatory protein
MSGHNKWKQIKVKKGKTDAMRSKVFSKYSRLITMEARKTKGDRNSPELKAVIERARKENMPNDGIDRAIKKATEVGGMEMERITYEAYGPGGCAMIIETLTENRNKAAQEVKHILSDHGFALAGIGSASWAFEKKRVDGAEIWEPTTTIPLSEEDGAKLITLTEALEENDEVQEVFTNAE